MSIENRRPSSKGERAPEIAERRRQMALGMPILALLGVASLVIGLRVLTPSAGKSTATQPGIGAEAPGGHALVNASDGVELSVVIDEEVESGKSTDIEITIANGRSQAIGYYIGECGSLATILARIGSPRGSTGKEWDGLLADAKNYIMESNRTNAEGPKWVKVAQASCSRSVEAVGSLGAGKNLSTSLAWIPSYVEGVPVASGSVPLTLQVWHGAVFDRFEEAVARTYQPLTVEGAIRVVGSGPLPVTQGQAIDSVLSDSRFQDWLVAKPKGEWRIGQAFLQYIDARPQGIVPAGASWEVDLFRGEDGPGGQWAIGFVDPFSGDLRSLTVCNGSCDH